MPTDEERREVARRLRELHPRDRSWWGIHGFDWEWFAGELLDAIGCDKSGCDEWTDHLADLIEPPYPDATASYRGWRAEVYDPDGVLVSPSSVAADLVRAHADGKTPDEPKVGCIAEIKIGGEKLDQLVNDAVVEVTGVDRDALLALADGLEYRANELINAAQHARFSGLGPTMERAKHDAYELRIIARRIREAMGVDHGD